MHRFIQVAGAVLCLCVVCLGRGRYICFLDRFWRRYGVAASVVPRSLSYKNWLQILQVYFQVLVVFPTPRLRCGGAVVISSCTFFTRSGSRMTTWYRPSHPYHAGTEHIGFLGSSFSIRQCAALVSTVKYNIPMTDEITENPDDEKYKR